MNLKSLGLLSAVIPIVLVSCVPASTAPKSLPASTAALNWVRYTDRAEGAFSMEVPIGWQVQGGMYRFGYFDVRWMMDIRSLDGKVIIRIDDADVPPYALPGPNTGLPGQAYFKPQQFQMVVENYREARSYADSYGQHRFSSVCKSLTPRESTWNPTMPAAWLTFPGDRITQATVAYDCSTADGPRIATVFARSNLHSSAKFWNVDPIISIIATPDAASLAQSMTQHMIDSWQENPTWDEHQKQMTQMGLNQIRANFGQFMQQMQAFHQQLEAAMNQQVAHYESQQHAQAQQVSGWGEALTGLTTVRDSTTGTEFQIFSGPKANYYTNGNGVTINSNLSPGPDFHQVNEVGP
jgi:hypothetical protein